jgi:hypothetical protein
MGSLPLGVKPEHCIGAPAKWTETNPFSLALCEQAASKKNGT